MACGARCASSAPASAAARGAAQVPRAPHDGRAEDRRARAFDLSPSRRVTARRLRWALRGEAGGERDGEMGCGARVSSSSTRAQELFLSPSRSADSRPLGAERLHRTRDAAPRYDPHPRVSPIPGAGDGGRVVGGENVAGVLDPQVHRPTTPPRAGERGRKAGVLGGRRDRVRSSMQRRQARRAPRQAACRARAPSLRLSGVMPDERDAQRRGLLNGRSTPARVQVFAASSCTDLPDRMHSASLVSISGSSKVQEPPRASPLMQSPPRCAALRRSALL